MIPDYYEFVCPVKVISGVKALSNLPYEMEQLGLTRALAVTDQGVVDAGLMKLVYAAMEGAKVKIVSVFDTTPPDSSNHVVNEVAKLYKANKCDGLIAVGGGSCIDTAKGVQIVITEDSDDLMKFQGTDRITKKTKPFVVIPTTAGTGSEVTAAAVIKNADEGIKMPFMSDKLYPDITLIDPAMTMTMPPKITATTGMDALTHAVEAYISLQKNPISDAFATGAIQIIFEYLIDCVKQGSDEKKRLAMANGAMLAGISFSNSMVGIVHALAHATGGVCGVPHGLANAIYLPWGLEFNMSLASEHIAELAPYMKIADPPTNTNECALAVIRTVKDLNQKLNELAGMPIRLRDTGVTEDKLEQIANAAINDGSCNYNPEEITFEDALAVIKKAF